MSPRLRVTVCELPDDPAAFAADWDRLSAHVEEESSDLVLLPEMPFSAWLAREPAFDPALWRAAVLAHEVSLQRQEELFPAAVLATRPVAAGALRLNEGFLLDPDLGYRTVHHKVYLPEEEGFWESTWFHRGATGFHAIPWRKAKIGFLICTDLWFTDHARAYGRDGAHILANPRATRRASLEQWLLGGRAAAIVSGAYCLSSNRVSVGEDGFGGGGFIVSPDGKVVASTSPDHPCITAELELAEAEQAKRTYPRTIRE